MTDKIEITVNIAGVQFKIPTAIEHEEVYRRAVDIVNEQYRHYLRNRPASNETEILSMVAFRMALSYLLMQNAKSRDSLIIESLNSEMETLIRDLQE